MIKKMICMVLLLLAAVPPHQPSAQRLIVTDQTNSETIMHQHFSLSPIGEVWIDQEKLHLLMERLSKQVYREPVNARLDDKGTIVPAELGTILDRQTFLEQFYSFYYGNESGVIHVPTKSIYPKVDSELLAEISTKEVGRFTTYYRENNKERSHNIVLAAKAIDNHVVFPGEKFSFNDVVGRRTKERGYKRAPVIVRGELAEDIGGGICQVSSTLFNAVNLKGVQIIERYSHSRRVPYVPPGKDATVSWWGPDFVFKNQYNQPILIRAASKHGKMTVRIFSSEAIEIKGAFY
ncbi:VanW family protein [Bacillus sp. B190/17]|uniref:VanW family protein n=1 Tax=Bacillus lumedeiriae TaxID=3058829 RepID=A0ABW8I5S9_9BACI